MPEQSLFGSNSQGVLNSEKKSEPSSKDDVVVFDLETQKDFLEVGGRDRPQLLKISVIGAYSYQSDMFWCWGEEELPKFWELMGKTKRLVGFNIKNFDLAVLEPYLKFDWSGVEVVDIFDEVRKKLGHRLSLNSIAQATLKAQKSAHGLEAIRMFKEGRFEDLKKYCLDDVRLTRDIYDFGRTNKYLLYKSLDGVDDLRVNVDFK